MSIGGSSGALIALLALGACTTMPGGPSELTLPGSGKSFEQFRHDDGDCRQYANAQVGGASASQVATESGVKSAAVGAGVGALAGAAIDGASGAGAGAGLGLMVGALAGIGAGDSSSWGLQLRYDAAYKQCMYAKGHMIPVYGGMTSSGVPPAGPVPMPGALTPPPPPPAPR